MPSYVDLPLNAKEKLVKLFLALPCFATPAAILQVIGHLPPNIMQNIPHPNTATLTQTTYNLLDTCAGYVGGFTQLLEAVRYFDGGTVHLENLVAEMVRLELRDSLPGAVWSDVPPKIEHFAGRTDELAKLRDALTNRKRAAICAVHGMGGVGKTSLATEYAYCYRDLYGIIGWLSLADEEGKSDDGLTQTGVAKGYSLLAAKLGLAVAGESADAVRDAVTNALARRNDWLLVFDNAENPAALRPLLPRGDGHVLITSRNADWHAIGRPVELDVLSEAAALNFLLDYAGRTNWADAAEEKAAKELVDALGHLPLALTQAAGYMASRRTSVADYLGLFRQRKAKLFGNKPLNYHKTVETTWNIGVDALKTERPDALLLLNLVAFLAPDPLRFELLREARDELSDELANLLDPANDYDLQEVKGALLRYGLAKIDEKSLTLHRLLALVTREKLPPEEYSRYAEYAARAISKLYPMPLEYTNWGLCDDLLRHAEAAAGYAHAANVAPDAAGYLYNQTGLYLKGRALYAAARQNFERAIAIDERVYGKEHPEVAIDYNNLGGVLEEMGEYGEARSYYKRAIAIGEQTLGKEHPTLAIRYNNLGGVLEEMGEYGEARSYYERAIAIGEQTLGKEHPDVATRYNNLGGVLRKMGEYSEARSYYERAIAIGEQVYEINHPQLAIYYNNLGGVLRAMGEYGEARKYYERAIAIFKRELGENHPNIAVLSNNLGGVLEKMGEYGEARSYYERAIAIGEQVYETNHPQLAIYYNNYGVLLYRLGDRAGARDYLRRALAIFQAKLGEQHPNTQGTARWLEIVGDEE